MKKCTILILCMLSSATFLKSSVEKDFYIDDIPYRNQTNQWIRTYILDYDNHLLIYPKELQMIANLIYFSFKRSYATLEGQSVALKTLDTMWEGWQNIAQTRLDPSKEQPHKISDYEKRYIVENFWQAHDQHIKIGKTYVCAVDSIVNGDFLYTIHAKKAVSELRGQGRKVVAQAIADIRSYVGELFHASKKSQSTKSIPFLDYLWDYLPKLAVSSFIEANNTNDIVSQKSWNILMKIQGVGKRTWQMIEQERAGLYLAFYKTLWAVMHKLSVNQDYLKIMFDEHGEITPENQQEFLPNPTILHSSQDIFFE